MGKKKLIPNVLKEDAANTVKTEVKKERKTYTHWYDKLPESKEAIRLRQQCREMGIDNLIW